MILIAIYILANIRKASLNGNNVFTPQEVIKMKVGMFLKTVLVRA
jgi:hypothetical protein